MLRGLKLTVSIVVIAGLGACASTPEPQAIPAPEPVAQKMPQKPVFEPAPPPAPVAVVEQPQAVDYGAYTSVTPGSVDDFLATAGDRVFFAYNEYSLSTKAREVLRAQANWMNSYPGAIAVIGGHADERGTREYNLALGAQRAESVKDFLVSQGVDPLRVTTVSYGKERPIAGGSDEAAWSLNRNGHTAIVSGATG